MYEILKAVCNANGWNFTYARKDFQNLYSEPEVKNVPIVFLDPVEISEGFGDMGDVESLTYSGRFLVLVSSDIDETDYEYRYLNYIKPLIDEALITIKLSIVCENELTFNAWRITEVINFFDYNADGVIISFNVSDTNL